MPRKLLKASVIGRGRQRQFPGRRNAMPVKWAWENLAKGDSMEIVANSPHTRTTIRTSLQWFVRTYELNWAFRVTGKGPFTVTRVR